MGKISKEQSKRHDEALALLSLSRTLSDDERELVFRQFNPLAEYNVGKNAVYFTPFDLAWEFAVYARGWDNCTYVDLGAGIGMLTWALMCHEGRRKGFTCVEFNKEFVDVGKKLVPEAEWVWGDMFDYDLWGQLGMFDIGISNPPYGNVFGRDEAAGWLHKGPGHMQAIEVILKVCKGGEVIIPEIDCQHDIRNNFEERLIGEEYEQAVANGNKHARKAGMNLTRLVKLYPGLYLPPEATDLEVYRDQWLGAAPNVAIVDVSVDGMDPRPPLGV